MISRGRKIIKNLYFLSLIIDFIQADLKLNLKNRFDKIIFATQMNYSFV